MTARAEIQLNLFNDAESKEACGARSGREQALEAGRKIREIWKDRIIKKYIEFKEQASFNFDLKFFISMKHLMSEAKNMGLFFNWALKTQWKIYREWRKSYAQESIKKIPTFVFIDEGK